MFVPRFPGIPEMLYFPTPKAEGNITSRGFPGTEGTNVLVYFPRSIDWSYLLLLIAIASAQRQAYTAIVQRKNILPARVIYSTAGRDNPHCVYIYISCSSRRRISITYICSI